MPRPGAGGFARAVGVVVGGTALGHAITAAAMPALTRLYTPTEFGMLAIFSAAFAIVAVAVCLRYELAVAIAIADDEAANLLAVAIVVAAAVSGALALVVVPAASPLAAWLGQPALAPHVWLLPVCTFLAGAFAALQSWLVRRHQFPTLARTRVAQSVAASGTQIALGVASVGPIGLIAGPIVNSGAGCLSALQRLLRHERPVLRTINPEHMLRVARLHSRFPRFSAAEALANSASIQLPVMLISALGSSAEAGYLMLAMMVVQAPMALLGSAVSQVYLSRAPQEARAGTLGNFTAEVIGSLLRSGVGPLLCLGIAAPFIFPPIFGEAWLRAGAVVAWLTPWFVVHFVTAPVSMALHVIGRQRLALMLQLGGLGLRVGAVLIAANVAGGRLSEAYALSGLAFYLLHFVVVARVAGCHLSQLFLATKIALPNWIVWVAVALGATIAVKFAGSG